jgi:hypothetical protein
MFTGLIFVAVLATFADTGNTAPCGKLGVSLLRAKANRIYRNYNVLVVFDIDVVAHVLKYQVAMYRPIILREAVEQSDILSQFCVRYLLTVWRTCMRLAQSQICQCDT